MKKLAREAGRAGRAAREGGREGRGHWKLHSAGTRGGPPEGRGAPEEEKNLKERNAEPGRTGCTSSRKIPREDLDKENRKRKSVSWARDRRPQGR